MSVIEIDGVSWAAGLDWLPRGNAAQTAYEARRGNAEWYVRYGDQTGFGKESDRHKAGMPALAAALHQVIPEQRWMAVLLGDFGGCALIQVNDGVKVATVEAGQVGRLVETISDFGKKVDDYVADFHRSKEIQARRRGWGRWALAGAVAPVLVVAGVLGQQQFGVIPDGTNGWKSIVWESHGLAVAKCMRRAQNSGNPVNCPLRVRPR